MEKLNGGLELVPGYRFSNIECQIRYKNRLDYSLIMADHDCNASAVFTTNKIKAAPVKISKSRINNPVRAILINATNANACTGSAGEENAVQLSDDIAAKTGIDTSQILIASTGIIGHQLPVEKMLQSHEKLLSGLSVNEGARISEAIMTTDTKPKYTAMRFETSMGQYTIAGTAKGAGMIAPNMATLLSFILTDAPVAKTDLDRIFADKIKSSFNSLTIDGDTSTNDTATILSPRSESYLTSREDLESFSEALGMILSDLSYQIVEDGEGVNHVVEINVINAASDKDAEIIARSISESLLVKTAIFGKDPNWGRIACAAGYSGAELDENCLSIHFDNTVIFQNGTPLNYSAENLSEILEKKFYTVTVDIGLGHHCSRMLTSDISYDYVRINAEYST